VIFSLRTAAFMPGGGNTLRAGGAGATIFARIIAMSFGAKFGGMDCG
jgi:hypothetical protein